MLRIEVPLSPEGWDEEKQEFVQSETKTLQLEHSLVSLSKWESKWEKPFLSKVAKTFEETVDYIRCMTITQNVDPKVYESLSDENIRQVNSYIDAKMTATWFSKEQSSKSSNEQITSELIYYWMISLNIPFECQKWHLNRLLTLVRVCNVKNQPGKKMSNREVLGQYAKVNASRRKQFARKR